MKSTIKHLIASLSLAAALSGVNANALADGIKIEFRDLNLSRAEDVAVLYSRIETVARRVCADSLSPWDAQRTKTFKRCYTAAIDDAVTDIGAPRLTALHREKKLPVMVGSTE